MSQKEDKSRAVKELVIPKQASTEDTVREWKQAKAGGHSQRVEASGETGLSLGHVKLC